MNEIKWVRLPDGRYDAYVKDKPHPTNEQLENSKKEHTLEKARKTKCLESYCFYCEHHYDIPSCYENIQKVGVCPYCKLYLDGKVSYITLSRNPTIDEALNEKRPGDTDHWVIRNECIRLRNQNENH